MKKQKWLRTALLIGLALWTSLAFSIAIPVPLMEEMVGNTLAQQMARMLRTGRRSLSDDHAMMLLAAGGAFWLYGRTLFTGSRRGAGEYVLAGFLALCLMFSRAVLATDSVSVLWANATQLLKAVVIWTGLCRCGLR